MKPDIEIQNEAERLERLARQWITAPEVLPASATLLVLPETRLGNIVPRHRRNLRIDVVREGDTPEFLLVEEETGPGRTTPDSDPLVLTRSDSAYDVLRDGYEAREEDRLIEFLSPIAERIGAEGFIEDADPELIEQIATGLEADHLAPSARLRTRADIVEFLEGRLSPSEFISAAIERQDDRHQEREQLGELLNERITIA